jgi:histidinol-phosphate aminotransferase
VALEEIAALLDRVPRHVCVIVDEAYCEFNVLKDPDASLQLLGSHSNLLLLRTFSKVYGLAGMRIGFGLCGSPELRTAVDQVRQPFFANSAAQAAAVEALRHQDEVARRVEQTIAARLELEEGLRGLGLSPAESQANFVWFDLGEDRDEAQIVRALAQQGVLVRAGTSLGREGALRVTCGTPPENARFLAGLAGLL